MPAGQVPILLPWGLPAMTFQVSLRKLHRVGGCTGGIGNVMGGLDVSQAHLTQVGFLPGLPECKAAAQH